MITDTLMEEARWSAIDLPTLAERAASAALKHLDLFQDGMEIAVLGCDDARIAALNADFRGKAQPTNVLSWPSEARAPEHPGDTPPAPQDLELGDIAIAFETCTREAEEAGKALTAHTTHLIVHATLHLLGYDHETEADAALMEGLESAILAEMGEADPYAES